MDVRASIPDRGSDFPLCHGVQTSSGDHSASNSMDTVVVGVKRLGGEPDNSPPSSDEIKNAWTIIALPQHDFLACYLAKNRDNFTFTFIKCCVPILLQYFFTAES
jgi:hypothetical protein